MDLEDIIRSKISRTEKTALRGSTYMWELKNDREFTETKEGLAFARARGYGLVYSPPVMAFISTFLF